MLSNFKLSFLAFIAALPIAMLLSLGFSTDRLIPTQLPTFVFVSFWALLASCITFILLAIYQRKVKPFPPSIFHSILIAVVSYLFVTFVAVIYRAIYFPAEWLGIFELGLFFVWYPVLCGWFVGYLIAIKPITSNPSFKRDA